jgi:SAM-dependent methyltransferase
MPAYDYSTVADIYDAFCVFDADLEYFRQIAVSAGGPMLELMAGTGRVSLPMLESGAELTCVDGSAAMLAVLDRKLRARQHDAHVVCGDVCRLPLGASYQLVVLPFQGFTELVGCEAQSRSMSEVARVLQVGGRFVCTSHNPAARGPTIDGQWHEFGTFENRAGGSLVVSLRTSYGERPDVVEGLQRIEIFDERKQPVERREIPLTFSLVPAATIVDMASGVDLQPVELMGDYDGASFDEASSPCLIAVFEKMP